MKVHIANFGYRNCHWDVCLKESVMTLQVGQECLEFWKAGDKPGYIAWAEANEKLVNGAPATPPVASRWFNLISIFNNTQDDYWLHRAGDNLYWTTSCPGSFTEEVIADPWNKASKRPFLLLRKPVKGWQSKNTQGGKLQWGNIHRKAYDFLITEATYQELSNDRGYRDFAEALINGHSLELWHNLPDWLAKLGKRQPGKIFSDLERTIFEAVRRIEETVLAADGRVVQRATKIKLLGVSNEELGHVLDDLYRQQEGLCALTGLRMLLNGEDGPKDMRLSVDRIDSSGHYVPSNVQLVCRFANFWKGSGNDQRFRELINVLKGVE